MDTAWPTHPGLHDCTFTSAAGDTVRATLSLPATSPRAAPLVLCLHYGGTPAGWYGRGLLESLYVPAWRDLGAVMVAPVAAHGDWTNERDAARALAVAAAVAAHFACGPRIVTGYSLGAIGTWHLLEQAPEAFVAAVPVAGPPPLGDASGTPVRALNSSADRLFPAAATRVAVEALAAQGRDAASVLVEGIDHYDCGGFTAALSALTPWLAARCAGP